jgi:hypothetical protein
MRAQAPAKVTIPPTYRTHTPLLYALSHACLLAMPDVLTVEMTLQTE